MKRTTAIACVVLSTTLAGCDLFVIGGSKSAPVIERSQRSSVAVVYLFKAELDSGHADAATDLMAHPSGRPLLAMEKYELKDEVARVQRLMAKKEITATKTDTLSASAHNVSVTIDYIRTMSFSTARIQNAWYITRLSTSAAQ